MTRYICAWCGRFLREESSVDGVDRESHDICAQCAAKHRPVTQQETEEALNLYWHNLEQ